MVDVLHLAALIVVVTWSTRVAMMKSQSHSMDARNDREQAGKYDERVCRMGCVLCE